MAAGCSNPGLSPAVPALWAHRTGPLGAEGVLEVQAMINSLGNRYLGKMQRAILDWLREHKQGTERAIGLALYVGSSEPLAVVAWAHKKLLGLQQRGLVRKVEEARGLSLFIQGDSWELDLVGRP